MSKKVLIATGVAMLVLASVAMAQGYTFSSNLTVGSTGPDVVALQTSLMAGGFNIPAIASGAAAKGTLARRLRLQSSCIRLRTVFRTPVSSVL